MNQQAQRFDQLSRIDRLPRVNYFGISQAPKLSIDRRTSTFNRAHNILVLSVFYNGIEFPLLQ